jgi:uncharacterized DUF497 family protein
VSLRARRNRAAGARSTVAPDRDTVQALYDHTNCSNVVRQYEWDDSKNALNIAKHGVGFELAQRIFDGAVLTVWDDRKEYGEVRKVSIGMVDDIAVLTVVHIDRQGKVRIISARPASDRERRRYEEAIR